MRSPARLVTVPVVEAWERSNVVVPGAQRTHLGRDHFGGGVMSASCWPATFVMLLLLATGCTGAAESSDVEGDAPAALAAGTAPAPGDGPCTLLSEAEVEKAMSVTIISSQVQAADALTRAFTFTMADDVCEYYGPRVLPSAAGGEHEQSDRHPDDSDLPAELPLDENVDGDTTMDGAGRGMEEARAEAEHIASQLDALELLVSVSAAPLSREEFKVRYERHVEAFARGGAASEDGALTVDLGFIETATDGAKDVGGIGDAARWYPAMAQLDVLVGDTAFTVTSLQQASLMAGMVFGAPADPLNDPPQKLVDIARLAAERL